MNFFRLLESERRRTRLPDENGERHGGKRGGIVRWLAKTVAVFAVSVLIFCFARGKAPDGAHKGYKYRGIFEGREK